MKRRMLLVLVAATLLPAWFVALTADEERVLDRSLADGIPAASDSVAPIPTRPGEPESNVIRAATLERGGLRANTPPTGASPIVIPDDDHAIRVSVPPFVEQGSLQDLVVGVRIPRGAKRVEFALSADSELVELRGASRGEGNPRGESTFEALVDEAANRIAIEIERKDGWPGNDIVDLAVVRFEGVASGDANVIVSGIVVRDAAGAVIPIAPSSATAQLVVMSGPI